MERDYDLDAPADVFIASKAGRMGHPRVLWRMTVRDAQAVCSHPSTAGQDWMLCWTTRDLIDTQWFAEDDGRFDALFDDLGITILASKQLVATGKVMPEAAPSAKPVEALATLPLFAELEG